MAHLSDIHAPTKRNIDFKILVIFGSIAFLLFFFLSVFAGTQGLSFADSLKTLISLVSGGDVSPSAKLILLKVRFPRAFAALLCGAALSVSGLILQLSLNNTLASPGIIGVNAGSGLFVLLVSLVFPYVALARSLGHSARFWARCFRCLLCILSASGRAFQKRRSCFRAWRFLR